LRLAKFAGKFENELSRDHTICSRNRKDLTLLTDSTQKNHPLEWLPVALEAVLLLLLWHRPEFLQGQLVPCLALGLAPGCAFRLAGRRSLSAHRFGISLGLIAFLFTNGTLHLSAIASLFTHWQLLAPALLLILIQPFLGAWRWMILLKAQEMELSFAESLRLVLVGFFFNTFVPGATGGDLFRIYYVARGQGKTGAAVASVVADRLMGLPPLILLVLAALLLDWEFVKISAAFRPYAWAAGVVGLSSLVFFWLLLRFRVSQNEEGWAHRLPGGQGFLRFHRALRTYRASGKTVLLALIISLIGHIASVGAAVLLGHAAGVEAIPDSRYALLVPLGLTINSIPALPGGLGQGEMAFSQLFLAASLIAENAARGATVMLGLRLGLILAGLAGGVLYALGRHEVDSAIAQAQSAGKEKPDGAT
jgi:uncharacterized protein (TIRG00374 family)